MKFGHFDDANREYVINTPQTPYPGSITWAMAIFSQSFPIPPAVTVFTVTPV